MLPDSGKTIAVTVSIGVILFLISMGLMTLFGCCYKASKCGSTLYASTSTLIPNSSLRQLSCMHNVSVYMGVEPLSQFEYM